ncbi:MAG: hypothetical protein D4R88_00430, partial [Methanosarcinales archaeon]
APEVTKSDEVTDIPEGGIRITCTVITGFVIILTADSFSMMSSPSTTSVFSPCSNTLAFSAAETVLTKSKSARKKIHLFIIFLEAYIENEYADNKHNAYYFNIHELKKMGQVNIW